VLVVLGALLLFGLRRLSEMARAIGKVIWELRNTATESDTDQLLRESKNAREGLGAMAFELSQVITYRAHAR
jgi:Sec-independent protein translocase protein TatA